ncbi:hypothetical protein FHG87_007626 [Trinorchestia longiramus]|nr:hypothetical protein FHG87_007626 [Trinorchestia longiramus]
MKSTGKGRFLAIHTESPATPVRREHPCRWVDCAISRLRLGHVGVAAHLHRFQLLESPLCRCGRVERLASPVCVEIVLRLRRGTSSLSSSGGDSDGWDSIDSSTECIPPTPSQPLSPSQVTISDGLCPEIGDTGELLGDQQTPIPAIETNTDKNVCP